MESCKVSDDQQSNEHPNLSKMESLTLGHGQQSNKHTEIDNPQTLKFTEIGTDQQSNEHPLLGKMEFLALGDDQQSDEHNVAHNLQAFKNLSTFPMELWISVAKVSDTENVKKIRLLSKGHASLVTTILFEGIKPSGIEQLHDLVRSLGPAGNRAPFARSKTLTYNPIVPRNVAISKSLLQLRLLFDKSHNAGLSRISFVKGYESLPNLKRLNIGQIYLAPDEEDPENPMFEPDDWILSVLFRRVNTMLCNKALADVARASSKNSSVKEIVAELGIPAAPNAEEEGIESLVFVNFKLLKDMEYINFTFDLTPSAKPFQWHPVELELMNAEHRLLKYFRDFCEIRPKRHALTHFLSGASKVQEMRLIFVVEYAYRRMSVPLYEDHLFANATWPRLRTLHLDGIIVEYRTFIDMLTRHGATLKHLHLSNCAIQPFEIAFFQFADEMRLLNSDDTCQLKLETLSIKGSIRLRVSQSRPGVYLLNLDAPAGKEERTLGEAVAHYILGGGRQWVDDFWTQYIFKPMHPWQDGIYD